MTRKEKEEKILKFTEANMGFEGFQVTECMRRECRRILNRECPAEEVVRMNVEKFKKEKR